VRVRVTSANDRRSAACLGSSQVIKASRINFASEE
jgi:hypothetical protein